MVRITLRLLEAPVLAGVIRSLIDVHSKPVADVPCCPNVCVVGSVSLALTMIVGIPIRWGTASVSTGGYSAVFMWFTRASSNCARGRDSPRNSRRNMAAFGTMRPSDADCSEVEAVQLRHS